VLQSIEGLSLNALEIPTHPRDGISLDALRFAIRHHAIRACLVIANFNNPLGSIIPDGNKEALVSLLEENDIPLIENNIFGEIFHGSHRPLATKAYDRKGLVMLCASFSKDLCPGYRVGWVAGGQLAERIEWLRYTSSLATATLPQLAIAEFIASGGYTHHLRKIRHRYALNVSALLRAVERHFPEGIRVSRPTGGFVVWIQLPEAMDALDLYAKALQHNIAIAPGHIFSSSDHYRNFIRLNAANWSDTAAAAVETLGGLLTKQHRR
jgi:DNA-binding transcriptional MocR family regulator